MADRFRPSEDRPVRIHAIGIGERSPAPGGWGAVLTYGRHKRELHGSEMETTQDRMDLLAAVQALECLTRPVPVQLVVDDDLRQRVARWSPHWRRDGWTPPEEAPDRELWTRLAAASRRHRIAWHELDGEIVDPDGDLAHELAAKGLDDAEEQRARREREREEEARNAPCDGPSIDSVLTEFLTDRRELCSPRSFRQYEKTVGTLRWSIGWYGDRNIGSIPAREIARQLPGLFETLVHKKFASADELGKVRRALPELLGWFQAQGHIDAEEAAAEVAYHTRRIDGYIAVRKFVNVLKAYAEDEPLLDAQSVDERVQDEYLEIIEVSGESITFRHPDESQVVSIAVPPDVARMARPGWEILLTAVRHEGRWHVEHVVNGEP